ncbi:hypothetical protein ACP70R_045612 [Stipagrostis hirtigluma subsp. patula]
MALSRPFVEYCIWGWDYLPRTVLMYYSISSPEGYFHTVACNTDEFKNTTMNHDLHYISWDNPPKQHPHHLTMDDLDNGRQRRAIRSEVPRGRPNARQDRPGDPVPWPGHADPRRLVRGDAEEWQRPLLGHGKQQPPLAGPWSSAVAEADQVAAVGGEVPPKAVQVTGCL